MKGRIVKGGGGFYYVKTSSGIYQTRGRGIFRKDGITPTVGDLVDMDVLEDGDGVINEICPRKNLFLRPPIANVDTIVIVFAAKHPNPNFDLIDKFLIMSEQKDVDVILCLNKCDLVSDEKIREIICRFENAYPVLAVCGASGEGIDKLAELLKGKCSALAGPSGVGKSTITNLLIPDAEMETSSVSRKAGRGRHTTRHVEIFDLPDGGMLFDTPGFTSFDLSGVRAEQLAMYYPEFETYSGDCYFDDCSHTHEPGCRVRQAVQENQIGEERYRSYVKIYQELSEEQRRR